MYQPVQDLDNGLEAKPEMPLDKGSQEAKREYARLIQDVRPAIERARNVHGGNRVRITNEIRALQASDPQAFFITVMLLIYTYSYPEVMDLVGQDATDNAFRAIAASGKVAAMNHALVQIGQDLRSKNEPMETLFPEVLHQARQVLVHNFAGVGV